MKDILNKMKQYFENNDEFVLVTIVDSSGSAPRGKGAKMIVTQSGRTIGTVGGGAIEYECEKIASELLIEKKSKICDFKLSQNQVADLGMICGGEVTVYFQYLKSDDNVKKLINYGIEKIEEGREATYLIMNISENKLNIYNENDKFFYSEDSEKEIINTLEKSPSKINIGDKIYFLDSLVTSGNVFIFGGGHVSQELVPVLSKAGFRCIVLDDREEFTKKELFNEAYNTMKIDYSNINQFIQINENDYIIIMTRGHKYDTIVESQVLKTNAYYIGVMGSRAKKSIVEQKLMDMGFSRSDIERVNTPIGLSIGAETPYEISISIAGELIQKRASRANS